MTLRLQKHLQRGDEEGEEVPRRQAQKIKEAEVAVAKGEGEVPERQVVAVNILLMYAISCPQ